MNQPGQAASLGGLMARLRQGAGSAARRSRPADWSYRDETVLATLWPSDAFAALAAIRNVPWTSADDPSAAITVLTAWLHAQPTLLATVLLSPDAALGQLLESLPTSAAGIIDSWIGLCWIAEAAWAAVTQGPPRSGGYTAFDMELLSPLAARLRFLVLSEPMRWRSRTKGTWWAWKPDQVFGGSGVLDRALGERSWGMLVGRCQAARREWLRCLNTYQSHPLLSQASARELEQEIRALVFRDSGGRIAMGISVQPLAEPAPLTAEDKAAIDEVTDRHLLPRFDVLRVAALAAYDDRRGARAARLAAGAAAAVAGLAAIACAAFLLIRPATVLAAVCYGLIGGGVVKFGTAWAAPWLLRLPAASAVGFIALVSILPGAWLGTPPQGWLATLALCIAACGYLIVEARNHGVEGRALWRALAVAAIGGAHALMISLIGLVVVAPAFVLTSQNLAALWQHPRYDRAGLDMALATAWCLAIGVFSQILWDDRPITAPLAHLSWRAR